MAMFDFLKPKWSASKLTDDDCRRQFWVLKRSTSYTAWKRCRERYAVFIDLLERQCKEEPIGRMGPKELASHVTVIKKLVSEAVLPQAALNGIENDYATEWTASTYADALRGLAAYDKGLARLAQGDRSVWMHNSQGVLEDAFNVAMHYYALIYQGGPKGGDGMVYYGKYANAMKAALLWAMENGGFCAGGLQPAMANMSSASFWSETRRIDFMGKKDKLILGTRDRLQRDTAHLKSVPEVPRPIDEVLVRTGEPCPFFGIYQPQVTDGLMAYMCQGEMALRYGEPCWAPGGGQPVTWKLIWADARYLDGVIPAEEADFYPDEPAPDFSRWVGEEILDEAPRDQLIYAQTGELAAYSGTWAAETDLGGRILWRKGDPLPRHHGRDTRWVFVPGV